MDEPTAGAWARGALALVAATLLAVAGLAAPANGAWRLPSGEAAVAAASAPEAAPRTTATVARTAASMASIPRSCPAVRPIARERLSSPRRRKFCKRTKATTAVMMALVRAWGARDPAADLRRD